MSKYLDLARLTTYDEKIKEWIKSGVVDITNDAISALFVTVAEGPADNEIWYTTSYGKIIKPSVIDDMGYNVWGATIIRNVYENDRGVITFDKDITTIGDMSFSWCSSLTSITIPNSVTSIGYIAFSWCSSLNSITIPNSVTRIETLAFQECSSLTSIIFEGTMEQWNSITKEGIDWNYKVPATYVQCSDGQVAL